MKAKHKYFSIHLEFNSQGIDRIKARTAAEAKRKFVARLAKKKLYSLVDHPRTFVDKSYYP